MPRRILLVLLLLLPLAALGGELAYEWEEGELFFPKDGPATYRYSYRFPRILGEDHAAGEVRHFFDTAQSEMQNLVLPMYAHDADMSGGGLEEIDQEYEVTLNSADFFSILLKQRQTLRGETLRSLSSQVFALSGPYEGELLTLRGLVQLGDSSQQIAGAVFEDVWQRIARQMAEGAGDWEEGFDRESLALDFYPEQHFYADADGHAVFYLQPGLGRRDGGETLFVYTRQELLALLEKGP